MTQIEIDKDLANSLNGGSELFCKQASSFLEAWQALNLPGGLPTVGQIRNMCGGICRNSARTLSQWMLEKTQIPFGNEALIQMTPKIKELERVAGELYWNGPQIDFPIRYFEADGTQVKVTADFQDYVNAKTRKIVTGRKAQMTKRIEELRTMMEAFSKDYPEFQLVGPQIAVSDPLHGFKNGGSSYFLFTQSAAGKPVEIKKELLSRIQ